MPSGKEQFFTLGSYAVVGSSSEKPFPRITYGNLKKLGKKVFPVDLSGAQVVEGDKAYPSLDALPEKVEGVISEVPPRRTIEVARAAAAAGIRDLWLHQRSDTPEALEFCEQNGIRVRHGGCAVMYTQRTFSHHHVHRFIWKLIGRY